LVERDRADACQRINKHVDGSKARQSAREHRIDLRFIRDVHICYEQALTKFLNARIEQRHTVPGAVGSDNRMASVEKGVRVRSADSACRASDYDNRLVSMHQISLS
jgi:hypothetical protein